MDSKLNLISSKAPKAYLEFMDFVNITYRELFDSYKISIDILPNEFIMGAVIKFFNIQNIDFSISETDENIIFDHIIDTLVEYENGMGHFS